MATEQIKPNTANNRQKCRWLRKPRRTAKWWVNETIDLSSPAYDINGAATVPLGFTPHRILGGQMLSPVDFIRRIAATDNTYVDQIAKGFPLNLPVGKVASANQTDTLTDRRVDTIVGFDACYMARDFESGVRQMATGGRAVANDGTPIMARCLAFKHLFMFTNYARHPVQVIAQFGPSAANYDLSGTIRGGNNSVAAHPDLSRFNNLETFIVPGTLDKGDAGARVVYPIKGSCPEIFGGNWVSTSADQARAAQETTTEPVLRHLESGGWKHIWSKVTQINPTVSGVTGRDDYQTFANGPLYKSYRSQETDGEQYPHDLLVRFYAKYVVPMSVVGVTGSETDVQLGSTFSGLTVSVKSSWLMECDVGAGDAELQHTAEDAWDGATKIVVA